MASSSFSRGMYIREISCGSKSVLDQLNYSLQVLILTRAGQVLGAERARRGGGGLNIARLTRLLGHVATYGKWHSKECQKAWRNFFGHLFGQVNGLATRGHQRSILVFFNIFRQIGTLLGFRKPEDQQRREKAHSIALLTAFRNVTSNWPKVNGLASREQQK